jgi:hypothetical protein
LVGLMNSRSFSLFVQMLVARVSLVQSFEVGLIQSIPIPDLFSPSGRCLGKLAKTCIKLKRNLDRTNEISHVFHLPALLQVEADFISAQSPEKGGSQESSLWERIDSWQSRVAEDGHRMAEHQHEIDDLAFQLYGIESDDWIAIEESSSEQPLEGSKERQNTESIDDEAGGQGRSGGKASCY